MVWDGYMTSLKRRTILMSIPIDFPSQYIPISIELFYLETTSYVDKHFLLPKNPSDNVEHYQAVLFSNFGCQNRQFCGTDNHLRQL